MFPLFFVIKVSLLSSGVRIAVVLPIFTCFIFFNSFVVTSSTSLDELVISSDSLFELTI